MKYMKLALIVLLTLLYGSAYSADVQWTSRLEGDDINGQFLTITDSDFDYLGQFTDVEEFGFVRLGIADRVNTAFSGNRTFEVDLQIIPYTNANAPLASVPITLAVEYSADGANFTVDGSDYRMPGTYKFTLNVDEVRMFDENGVLVTGAVPSYLFLEAGIQAERYYILDDQVVPTASVQMINYDAQGSETEVGNLGNANDFTDDFTDALTDELYITWDYVEGAEYYDLEWVWLDNYDFSALINTRPMGDISLTEQEFKYNSTRIRTSQNFYRIPQIFARGYVVYRVRGVGRWQIAPSKDLFGEWSSNNGVQKDFVDDWPNVITVTVEHEAFKNWQYQATYAEDGKKKEVTQYFDGSLRGRQTVTRINSDNNSVVGETIYDNEGRGVVQILPVPQENPAIKFYQELNTDLNGVPYSHLNFDWETSQNCTVDPADPLSENSGAGRYYSESAHATDEDWQQHVPESFGYPFTQVEYTPDNTGRIRNQSGVGIDHRIGSNNETYYYYAQPTQEELNRLFGVKVGFMSRYKKNMVVDANGQASVSYLDAQGRVIATSLVGDNLTEFNALEDASSTYHGLSFADLLNKDNQGEVDDDQDNNDRSSTGTFGSAEDRLEYNTQFNVVQDGDYNFFYDIQSYYYTEDCNGTDGVSYPYVYDLKLSLKDDCGNEVFAQTYDNIVGNDNLTSATVGEFISFVENNLTLERGTYTLSKQLTVNEEALEGYIQDYLDPTLNDCLLSESDFEESFTIECDLSCDECVAQLGDLNSFLAQAALDEGGSLNATQEASYTVIWQQLKDDCMAPCTPTTNCDAYYGMMLGDVSPGGQYAALDPTDVLSVLNPSTLLNGSWENPSTPYLDEFGNTAYVTAYPVQGGGFTLVNNGSAPQQVLPQDLSRLDFIASFEPSWADALIPLHPEYPLYEYAEVFCTEPRTIATNTGSTDMTSEEFDYFLRHTINTFDQADDPTQNPLGIKFTDIEITGLNAVDPYFTATGYTIHNNLLLPIVGMPNYSKNSWMDEALTNYKGQGMTMLQASVKAVIYGNNYAIDNTSTEITSITGWGSISSFTVAEQDAIWQQYKGFYLSYKAEINQLLMDIYGYNLDLFNGCIGPDALSLGILGNFTSSTYFGNMTQSTLSAFTNGTFPITFPIALCLPQYDTKQLRIVRVDGLQNPSTPTGAQMADQQAAADYEQWSQTGLCPLTVDMERLLNELGTAGLLASTSVMADVNTMVPDLYTAFTGIQVLNNPNPSQITMDLVGTPGPGNSLTLDFVDNLGMTVGTITIDPIPGLSWTDYANGLWTIDQIYQSHPTGVANNVEVIIVATSNGVTNEYVVEYQSSIDLNACQADYAANNQDDPNCSREEEFESAMLALLQDLVQSGEQATNGFNLTSLGAYNQAVLQDYFGFQATWDLSGMTSTIIHSYGTFDLGQSLPSNILLVNGFDIVGGELYLSTTTGTVTGSTISGTAISNTNAPYSYSSSIGGLTDFDFNCECVELLSDQAQSALIDDIESKMLALINVLWNAGSLPAGTQLPEIDAIVPYFDYYFDVPGAVPSLSSLNVSSTTGIFFQLNNGISSSNLNFAFEWNGTTPYIVPQPVTAITGVSIDPVTNWYTLTLQTQCETSLGSGIFEPCEQEVEFFKSGDLNPAALVELPCEDCNKPSIAPVSCTSTYEEYVTFMDRFSGDLLPDDPNMDEAAVFASEYVGTLEEFCNGSYAYGFEAYEDYIEGLNITTLNDPLFLTIGEFVSTGIGYSQADLLAATAAYVAAADPTANPKYADPSSLDYLPWNNFVQDIYLVENTVCAPALPIFFPETIINYPCDQWQSNVAVVNMQNQYNIYLQQIEATFVQAYLEGALNSVVENFSESHDDKEFHYTLYYYDRAGNLIQTVPPQGVSRFEYDVTETSPGVFNEAPIANIYNVTGASNNDINDERVNNPGLTANGAFAPEHEYETEYAYNSLNQLVYQNTPDGGESRFAYDALGRLILSQNAKQKEENQFSYTKYDFLGRVIEVGELTAPGSGIDYAINDNGRFTELQVVGGPGGPVLPVEWPGVNSPSFPNNLTTNREEITYTIYDELFDDQGNEITVEITSDPVTLAMDIVPARLLFGGNYAFDNTRNRIVSVLYQEDYNADVNVYESGIFYNYDVHGNVSNLIQVYNDALLKPVNQHIKQLEYSYDLVSGNVNEVIYQKDRSDQFIHRYCYDADNRITVAETSKDGVVFEKDAKYFYYDHGPLARTEIGEDKVQACDYAYTIQGWIKTVNGERVSEETMMGQDGKVATINGMGARDVHGFSLSYYDNDYVAAGDNMLNHSVSAGNVQLGQSLYNGNIRSMYTAISTTDEIALEAHQTKYSYDQLNRINSMDGFNVSMNSVYASSGYSSTYSFDRNGNLETLTRNAFDGTNSVVMDDFTYHYDETTTGGGIYNNQLSWVEDVALNASGLEVSRFSDADIDGSMMSGNYDYDAIGQLTQDADEGILDIDWKVTNKVEQISFDTDGDNIEDKSMHFDYDAMGNRIAKHVTINGETTSTFYILDAQGNQMAIYRAENSTLAAPADLVWEEFNIYGSSRVGQERMDQVMDYVDLTEGIVHRVSFSNDLIVTGMVPTEEAGTWAPFDVDAGGPVYFPVDIADHGGSPENDLRLLSSAVTGSSLYFGSLWNYMNTIPGETYSYNFTILDNSMNFLDGFFTSDVSGAPFLNQVNITGPGLYSTSFTAQTNKSRLKFFGIDTSPGNPGQYTISDVYVVGLGDVFGKGTAPEEPYFADNLIGDKRYELSNHLGNVLNVITDRKLPVDDGAYDLTSGTQISTTDDGFVDYYLADVIQYNDYYPFGMTMPGERRTTEVDQLGDPIYVAANGVENPTDGYRYSFNGMESDDDIKGAKNSYNFGARFYDPRIGRWLSMDAKHANAPNITPYRYGFDNPIRFYDPDGNYERDGHFWTVLLVATMLGLEDAYTIAFYSEWPDHIMDDNGNVERDNPTWKDYDLQKKYHAFGGTHTYQKGKYSRQAKRAINKEDPKALGIALHGFGDSFSHRHMSGDGEDMYNPGVGHAHHWTDPDKIRLRPKTYKWYVRELITLLGGDPKDFKGGVFDYIANSGLDTEDNAAIFRAEFNMLEHDYESGPFKMENMSRVEFEYINSRNFSDEYQVKIDHLAETECANSCVGHDSCNRWETRDYWNVTITKKTEETKE